MHRFIRRLSLTHRLLALTLAAAVPGLLALATNAYDLRQARSAEIRAEALHNTERAVSEINQVFVGIRGVLQSIAVAADIRGDGCGNYLERIRQGVQAVTSLLVVNPDGTLRCSSEAANPSANLADRPYFQRLLSEKGFIVGDYVRSRVTGLDIVPVALPVVENGSVTAVVMAGLNLKWLGIQIAPRNATDGSAIILADRNGTVVWREPDPDRFVGQNLAGSNLAIMTGADSGSAEIESLDGMRRIIGYVPASLTPFGLSVATGVPKNAAFARVDEATKRSLLLFALGSVGALVLAFMVGEGMIRKPLMKVVATAEAWRRGHDMARTGIVDREDEIGLLGQTFDRLMDENQLREAEREISEARRDILIRELAHRVKNTLATVQSIASLSFRHSQGPEALRSFQDRLQALVRSHDLLTKHNWQHADLADIIAVALAPHRESRAERFVLNGPPADLPATTAVPMAMIMHELCTNAVKYGALSRDGGRVEIRWTAAPDPRGTAISLTWSESGGPPVSPPQQEGFGTRLMENLTRQMNGHFQPHYSPSGFVCHFGIISPTAAADEAPARAAE